MNTATPETVGLSTERLSRIDTVMQSYVDEEKLAGIGTMVARRGKIAHQACVGMADIAAGKPIRPDTIFLIYSMIKPVTSVALMLLLEEGHFQLDDPVSAFIPELGETEVFVKENETGLELTKQERPITIQHLLTHTSGIPYGNPHGSPVEKLHHEELPALSDMTVPELAKKLSTLPLMFQPGSAWHYGTSFEILNHLVVSGQSFDQFQQEKMFKPLRMMDTGFYVPEEKLDQLANVYEFADGGLRPFDNEQVHRYSRPVDTSMGGSGLVTTAGDFIRFCQMLLNRGELEGIRLLGRKTVEMMTRNRFSPQQLHSFLTGPMGPLVGGHGFGLGFRVMTDASQVAFLGSEGEYGWAGSANTFFLIDPKEEMCCLFMTQFVPMFHYAVERQFKNLAYQAIVD